MGTRPQHDPAYKRMCGLLHQWRLDVDRTKRALGRKLRKAHTLIHKVESGDRRIDPIEMIRWCRACGIDPREAIEKIGTGVRRSAH